jgi:hypothetical protein
MYDYLKLIIFNIIIIFLSFTFKKHIIIFYPFLLLFMLSYETILKNKLVEGNIQDDLYKTISNLKENEEKMNLPLGKIEKILEKMLEKFSGTKMTDDNKCQGEFYINKLTNKECGEGFNERLYKIVDEGDGNCLHSELYKEKVPLPPCKFNEECYSDLDCESNNCSEDRCIDKLDCNENMLSGCNRRSCLALNSGLDRDIYYYQNNECKVDPCNEQNYRMCDESGCNSLSYKYKFNDTRGICEQIVQEVDNTGLTTGSYMSLISGFGDKGCNKNNPEDCSGVCSEFDKNTTESCSIGGTIDNPKPNYLCKTPSDNNYYYNINIRDTGNIYDNTNRFPCLLFSNEDSMHTTITLTGIDLINIQNQQDDIKRHICVNILKESYNTTQDCIDNIELKEGSLIIEFKTSINQDEINLQDISEKIKNYLENLNLEGIVSIEIDPIQTNSLIQETTCNDNQIIQNGMCKTCQVGTHKEGNICQDCPAGTYGVDTYECIDCADNTYTNKRGSQVCPRFGSSVDLTRYKIEEGILKCDDGYGVNNGECQECPEDTYSNNGYCILCTEQIGTCGINLHECPKAEIFNEQSNNCEYADRSFDEFGEGIDKFGSFEIDEGHIYIVNPELYQRSERFTDNSVNTAKWLFKCDTWPNLEGSCGPIMGLPSRDHYLNTLVRGPRAQTRTPVYWGVYEHPYPYYSPQDYQETPRRDRAAEVAGNYHRTLNQRINNYCKAMPLDPRGVSPKVKPQGAAQLPDIEAAEVAAGTYGEQGGYINTWAPNLDDSTIDACVSIDDVIANIPPVRTSWAETDESNIPTEPICLLNSCS